MSITTQGSYLGNRVLRTEDRELITGAGDYTADLPHPGAYHAVFIRSPIAHGTLGAIDVDEARALPGVEAVHTFDTLGLPPRAGLPGVVPDTMSRPHLAHGKVRFVGDIVAVIIARTAAQAQDAAEAVVPDIEPLPAVTGYEAPLADGAGLLFDDAGTNVAAAGGTGEIEGLFDGADHVVRATFVNQRIAGVPMEPNGCVAVPGEPGGGVTMWLPTQTPHGAQAALAGDLGLEPDLVRVIAPRVGGGFGPKAFEYIEWSIVARAALLLGHPVRWTETRSENMLAMVHGRAQRQDVELGLTREGRIVGLRAGVVGDVGAYPMIGTILPTLTHLMSQGVYDIPKIEFSWRSVATNTTPVGAYRGAGRPEATQMLERVLDIAADELDLDPTELRRLNFIPPESFPMTTVTGAPYDNGEYARTLDAAIEAAGYRELCEQQRARRAAGDRSLLGIGVGCYVEVTAPLGLDGEWGSAQAHPDGGFTVSAGTSAHGQGHETAFAQVASAVLKVPMEKIRLVQSDTAQVPRGAGTLGSRSLQTGGSAIHSASGELVNRAREIAAHLLEASVDDIELTEQGLGVRGVADRVVTWAQAAAAAEDGSGRADGAAAALREELDFTQGQSSFPFGTHIAVVEVDADTGRVSLLRHVAVDDCGKILNPMLVEGQQHGGIAQGISQALFENVGYDDDGNPTSGNLASYTIPSAADLCGFEASTTETPTHLNPLGAKGIGESGTIGSTPAVHNAVVDALSHLGVRHVDMPLTPQNVWRALSTTTTA
ncbi:xanthine dehydrogenase family protein molybdopterin-binding subunit [Pseudonocardia parietis]|uniref:Carbon-monoxide dehydrogenase large subunit n=1 Tax=Pseudonocardia parietis TaxID=570936 RepID=A0ABS4VW17_9PSEU|nr:xanthine dehydrogenase family protein molybdopterin-binding subunit [Pseudonocardia parietis]MBP2368127.1 carbon-monoxide dehydrogenase large subunit [Pseudonocardia parietis]